jgi:sec-independent protein translocase protein TatB
VFDLSVGKLVVLVLIGIIVFGPRELPRIAQQAGRALRDLRRIAQSATSDLREGLGPEFQDFDFEDLNPRRFVQKHLLDDAQPLLDDLKSTSNGLLGTANGAAANGASANGTATAGTAVANGTRATLLDGAEPPFDIEAT